MQPHAATKGGFKILEQKIKIGRKTARNGRQSPWGKKASENLLRSGNRRGKRSGPSHPPSLRSARTAFLTNTTAQQQPNASRARGTEYGEDEGRKSQELEQYPYAADKATYASTTVS